MSRFEIVRSDAEQPWHARFIADNGRTVWTTENYNRRRNALNAIRAMVDPFLGCWLDTDVDDGRTVDAVVHRVDPWNKRDATLIEIRDVDERGAK